MLMQGAGGVNEAQPLRHTRLSHTHLNAWCASIRCAGVYLWSCVVRDVCESVGLTSAYGWQRIGVHEAGRSVVHGFACACMCTGGAVDAVGSEA